MEQMGAEGCPTICGTVLQTEDMEEQLTSYLLERLRRHDSWSHAHSVCVGRYAERIGRQMGLDGTVIGRLSIAARLHDVGKLLIPASVLDKPAPLTESEYQLVMQHAWYGCLLLTALGYPDDVCEAVRDHHERPDGRGYGRTTMAGLSARVICVADSYDAMRHSRPYRKERDKDVIFRDMVGNMGRQFDPDVCRAAFKVLFQGGLDVQQSGMGREGRGEKGQGREGLDREGQGKEGYPDGDDRIGQKALAG